MAKLYSYKGAYPYPLPDNMGLYDPNDFMEAPKKPPLLPDEKLDWDGNDWVVRPANDSEVALEWQRVREERNRLLAETDILILRAYESDSKVPEQLKFYRQWPRDITAQPNPFKIKWPRLP